MLTTIVNDTTTLNLCRCPQKPTIKDDIHDDEFRKVCPLLPPRKEVVKAVQSLQGIVAWKGLLNPRDRRQT
jgi:hypothetical protein